MKVWLGSLTMQGQRRRTGNRGAHMSITSSRISEFGEVVRKLETHDSPENIRHAIFPDIVALMEADFGATYRWNTRTGSSEEGGYHNMYAKADEEHTRYFQHHDPISRQMRAARRAIRVEEVIERKVLEGTEFWNAFLKQDGLHFGVNLFLFDGMEDIGDLRLWRARNHRPFDEVDLALLDGLAPHLKRAILRQSERYAGLTPRERDIVHLVAKGCRDQDIGRILGISFSTVRTHLNKAMEKRGCANRAELAASLRLLS